MRSEKSRVTVEGVLLKKEEFQSKLQNRFEVLSKEGNEGVEEMVSMISNAIEDSAVDTTGRCREKGQKRKDITKTLLKRKGMIERNTMYKYRVCGHVEDHEKAIEGRHQRVQYYESQGTREDRKRTKSQEKIRMLSNDTITERRRRNHY